MEQPFIYLAPIRGLTDALFREILFKHFGGFDAAVAPFINPQTGTKYQDRIIRDILPENNQGHTVIPQLLNTKANHFLALAERLSDLGYTHINWNLGCPAPMIAKKKRGSGMLPYPGEIIALLEEVVPKLTVDLSIKTRLGFFDFSEIEELLPKLNAFPLKELIIHARLGKQLYKGTTFPEKFIHCRTLTNHTLTYNGDITDVAVYNKLKKELGGMNRWMIGRGALANPLIAEEIKGMTPENSPDKKARIREFHTDLVSHYKQRLSGDSHILGRTKQLWVQMISSFPGKEKLLKKIQKSRTLETYLKIVDEIFS